LNYTAIFTLYLMKNVTVKTSASSQINQSFVMKTLVLTCIIAAQNF